MFFTNPMVSPVLQLKKSDPREVGPAHASHQLIHYRGFQNGPSELTFCGSTCRTIGDSFQSAAVGEFCLFAFPSLCPRLVALGWFAVPTSQAQRHWIRTPLVGPMLLPLGSRRVEAAMEPFTCIRRPKGFQGWVGGWNLNCVGRWGPCW